MRRPQTKMVQRPIQASRNQERIVRTDATSRSPMENLNEADFGTPAFPFMVANGRVSNSNALESGNCSKPCLKKSK